MNRQLKQGGELVPQHQYYHLTANLHTDYHWNECIYTAQLQSTWSHINYEDLHTYL